MRRAARFWLYALAIAVIPSTGWGATADDYARKIAPLVEPAKLATIGQRATNPRVQKYVAWLALAKEDGARAESVARRAVSLAGMKGRAAKLTSDQMVRNLRKAEQYGCLEKAGLEDMRRGRAPTVQRGSYKGDELSVDHIIPRTVAPELDNVIANLELMPLKMNEAKNSNVSDRQLSLARKLHRAHLLTDNGLKAVEKAAIRNAKQPSHTGSDKPVMRMAGAAR